MRMAHHDTENDETTRNPLLAMIGIWYEMQQRLLATMPRFDTRIRSFVHPKQLLSLDKQNQRGRHCSRSSTQERNG